MSARPTVTACGSSHSKSPIGPTPSIDGATELRYRGASRNDQRRASYDVVVRPTAKPAGEDLDVFLTGRWSAYVKFGPAVVRWDVQHEPWALREAELVSCDESLFRTVGIVAQGSPCRAHLAQGVSARLAPGSILREQYE
jgi:uncharacterized protein YqjF (DUF2071 family)